MQNGIFNSNLYNSYAQYHSFVVDDPGLNGIGIGSYTLSSISGFFQSSGNKELLGGDKTNDFTCSTTSNLNLLYFNKSTKKYELKVGAEVLKSTGGESYSDLKSFLDDHDNNELGFSTSKGKADIDDIVTSIQNSYSGCITFPLTYTSQGCSSTTLIKLYLKNRKNSSTNRSIGLNGSPLISEVPRRATGAPYSYRGTEDLPIGAYQQPFQNGKDNPYNTISAPLKLTYNQSAGQWESGTQQILARLLTDIDPAPVTNNPSIFTNIDDISSEDLYDSESYAYLSEFTTGFALPLSKENGNPHQFGPNFNGCDTKKEKILVVNRTPQAFAKGSIVLCSNIDGEWIIQGFRDDGKVGSSVKVGKWSFQKYIANADSFFKLKDSNGNFKSISPDYCEANSRSVHYNIRSFTLMYSPHWTSLDAQELIDIAKLNLYNPRSKPNKPYYDFDEIDKAAALNVDFSEPVNNIFYHQQVNYRNNQENFNVNLYPYSIQGSIGKHMGGILNYNIFSRTNIERSYTNPIEEGILYQEEVPAFWGATFPNGYQSDKYDQIKNLNKINEYIIYAGYFNDRLQGPNEKTNINILSNDPAQNKGASGNLMFSDTNDRNLVQMPGELAVHSKSNPIMYVSEGGLNPLTLYSNGMTRIFMENAISGDAYGLNPISPNRIQFSPLQLEFVAQGKTNDRTIIDEDDKDKYKYLRSQFFNILKMEDDGKDYMSSSLAIGPQTYLNGEGPIGWPVDFGPKGKLPLPAADDKNKSGKSNVVGIIASKHKFTGSNSITFTTKQSFGLLPKKTVAGFQAVGLSILPLGGGLILSTPSNPGFTKSLPQWGSYQDRYDSFGTTALHTRIFEAWPDNQTFYDGRFFSVLHFNPSPIKYFTPDVGIVGNSIEDFMLYVSGNILDSGITYTGPAPSGGISSVKYERSVDASTSIVDFRIPTYGFGNNDNNPIPVGTVIDRNGADDTPIRQPQEWRISTIRRGQLLTKGGFRYYRRTIGLNENSYSIRNPGTGFSKDQEISIERDIKIKIVATGVNGSINSISLINKGINFLPPDFSSEVTIGEDKKYGYLANLPSLNGSGAQILFENGIVYNKLAYDAPPLEMTSAPVRLTLPSYNGEKRAEGTLTTTIALESNKINFDAFYFFHNDPLHTIASRTEPFIQGTAQYVILEIGGST